MCGGGIGGFLEPITDLGISVFAPELLPFLPAINAAETTGIDLAKGQGLGKSLRAGAISGGLTLGGQELAGAVGLGQGNSIFNNALGITGDNPAGTGLPDLGKMFSDTTGLGGSATSPNNAGTALSPGGSADVSGAPISTPSAGGTVGSAGGSAVGSAAPAGVGADPLATGGFNLNTSSLDNLTTQLNAGNVGTSGSIGTGATSTPTVGSGNFSAGSSLSSAAQAAGSGGNFNVPTPVSDSLVGGGGLGGGSVKPPSSIDSFLSAPGLSTGFDVLKANPGAAISAGGIGLDLLKGNKELEGERQLKGEANQLATQGNQLQNYLQSGTLPPGLQAGVHQASEAAKATIRSQYARQGLSGSSAEQQALSQVDINAQAQGAQMAMQLLSTGISETGMASQLYQNLLNEALKQDQTLSSAIGNFASAAAGGNGLSGIRLVQDTGAGGHV